MARIAGHRAARPNPTLWIYTFDDQDRLAGERIYYDRSAVFAQLGDFHDPKTLLGRTMTAITHPITMARVAVMALRKGR